MRKHAPQTQKRTQCLFAAKIPPIQSKPPVGNCLSQTEDYSGSDWHGPDTHETWDTIRVWWAPVLMQGKLHVIVFDENFPGEEPAGASLLVPKVMAAINLRFPYAEKKPTCMFVDRGRGFYNPSAGKITADFKLALQECGLKAFWGDDASAQPGHLQELLLQRRCLGCVFAWRGHSQSRSGRKRAMSSQSVCVVAAGFFCNRWNLCVEMFACICFLFVLEWIIRGDSRGTRRGSLGDSHRFKGTRAQEHRFPLGFWGTRVRPVSPCIILKGRSMCAGWEICSLGECGPTPGVL